MNKTRMTCRDYGLQPSEQKHFRKAQESRDNLPVCQPLFLRRPQWTYPNKDLRAQLKTFTGE